MQKVAVVILNFKVADYTIKAVDSVFKSDWDKDHILCKTKRIKTDC